MFPKKGKMEGEKQKSTASEFSLATSDIQSYKLECLPVAELNYCHPNFSSSSYSLKITTKLQ